MTTFGYRESVDAGETHILMFMRKWCGLVSYQQIANRLNQAGHTTRTGRPWCKQSVGFHLRPAARQGA